MVPDGSSSNCEGNFRGRISSPSDVPGSGEGSMEESKDVEGEGSDLATRRSSWLDLCSSRRGLGLTAKLMYLMIFSRISIPSAGILWRGTPPVMKLDNQRNPYRDSYKTCEAPKD
jgi:hypothetical protein